MDWLLVVAIVAAIVLFVVVGNPIHSHGGVIPFEGVESADRADREAGIRPYVDRRRYGHQGPSGPRK